MNSRLLDLAFEFGRTSTDASQKAFQALKSTVARDHERERSLAVDRQMMRLSAAARGIEVVQTRITTLSERMGTEIPRTFTLAIFMVASAVSIVAEVVFTYDTLAMGLNLDGWEGWLVAAGIATVLFAFKPPQRLKARILPVAALLMIVAFTYLGWFRSAYLGLGDAEDIRAIIKVDPTMVAGMMVALTLAYLVAASILISHSMDYFELWAAMRERNRRQLELETRIEDRLQWIESLPREQSIDVVLAEMDVRYAQGLDTARREEPGLNPQPELRRFEGVEGAYAQAERILEHHLVKAVEPTPIPQFSLN
jgi:hypothetical protein